MSCIIKAIADPTRRTILRSLSEGHPVALPGGPGAASPDLAEHLRVLRQAGLVRELGGAGGSRFVLERGRLHELTVFLQAVVAEV